MTPCANAASTPSGNGKNASEASTLPCGLGACLLTGDLHAHHAGHLPGADADRRRPLREHDRVRLDVLAYAPRELERFELRVGGRALRDDLAASSPRRAPWRRASGTTRPPLTRLYCERGVIGGEPGAGGEETEVLLGAQDLERVGRERRRHDALDERLGEDPRGLGVDLAVQRDDAAERRQRDRPRAPSGTRRQVRRATRRRTGWCA